MGVRVRVSLWLGLGYKDTGFPKTAQRANGGKSGMFYTNILAGRFAGIRDVRR